MGHVGTLVKFENNSYKFYNPTKAVQANGNKINLPFVADGRRTSNKIGTVMAVLSLLEEESYGCDHLYAIALYNGMVLNPKIQLFLCVFCF